MASETSIINSGLSKIGGKAITSRTDGSKNANLVDPIFDDLRDDLLRFHEWNFATTRVALSQLVTTPVTEFDYAYQLPTDWVRTLAVHDNDAGLGTVPYRIEGLTVLSDADELWLKYAQQVTNPNLMPPDFREALSYKLAMDLAIPIANSRTLSERMEERFVDSRQKAMSVDALEDTPEAFPESSWTSVRG